MLTRIKYLSTGTSKVKYFKIVKVEFVSIHFISNGLLSLNQARIFSPRTYWGVSRLWGSWRNGVGNGLFFWKITHSLQPPYLYPLCWKDFKYKLAYDVQFDWRYAVYQHILKEATRLIYKITNFHFQQFYIYSNGSAIKMWTLIIDYVQVCTFFYQSCLWDIKKNRLCSI